MQHSTFQFRILFLKSTQQIYLFLDNTQAIKLNHIMSKPLNERKAYSNISVTDPIKQRMELDVDHNEYKYFIHSLVTIK